MATKNEGNLREQNFAVHANRVFNTSNIHYAIRQPLMIQVPAGGVSIHQVSAATISFARSTMFLLIYKQIKFIDNEK